MANIKSQKKRNITNEKARKSNRAYKSALHTASRAVREAAAAGNGAEAIAAAHKACRLLDKAASKGIIHKNQAANRKSGLMKLAMGVATAEEVAAYKAPEKKQPVAKGGTKKAAKKAARAAAYAEAAKVKEANRKKTLQGQAAAEKRKAEEAAAAAAAEAAEAEEAAE